MTKILIPILKKLLFLKMDSLEEFYKQRTFKPFMETQQIQNFAKIAKSLEKEIIEKLEIKRPQEAFLREPVKYSVGSISGLDKIYCSMTNKLIPVGQECILFILKTRFQDYIIAIVIKNEKDFDDFIKRYIKKIQ